MRRSFNKRSKKKDLGPVLEGCAIDGKCEGLCRKLHRNDCTALYRYRIEENKRTKRSARKWIKKII